MRLHRTSKIQNPDWAKATELWFCATSYKNGIRLILNVTIDEIQRDPLKDFHQVEASETLVILRLVIVRSDKPIAELRPIASSKQLRPFGLCAGEFTVPCDFDVPLQEDLLSALEGK